MQIRYSGLWNDANGKPVEVRDGVLTQGDLEDLIFKHAVLGGLAEGYTLSSTSWNQISFEDEHGRS